MFKIIETRLVLNKVYTFIVYKFKKNSGGLAEILFSTMVQNCNHSISMVNI